MRSIIFNWRFCTRNCFNYSAQQPLHRLLCPSYCAPLKRKCEGRINVIARRGFLNTLSSHNSVKESTKPVEVDNDKEKKDKKTVIYYGPHTSRIKGIKVFTCVTSLAGMGFMSILVQNILSGENLTLALALSIGAGFYTFIMPFLIHAFTKKYVTEMEYNAETDTYTAVTLSFFIRKINLEFKVEDVTVPNSLSILSTMSIKGRPVFIVSDYFLEVKHYIRLMGYDKPMDLQLESSSDLDETKK